MTVVVRNFRKADAEATALIFYDAVRRGSGAHYTDTQKRAWAPSVPDIESWLARIAPQTALVAELDDRVVGFMTLTEEGCIDLAFVAPDQMGRGVATQLYVSLCEAAAVNGLRRLWTDASHAARRFFEREGWTVVKTQTAVRNGVALTNFRMEKIL